MKDNGETAISSDLADQQGETWAFFWPRQAFLLLKNQQQCLRPLRSLPSNKELPLHSTDILPASPQAAMVSPTPEPGTSQGVRVWTCKPHSQGSSKFLQSGLCFPALQIRVLG